MESQLDPSRLALLVPATAHHGSRSNSKTPGSLPHVLQEKKQQLPHQQGASGRVNCSELGEHLQVLVERSFRRLQVAEGGLFVDLDSKDLPAFVNENVIVAERIEQTDVGQQILGDSLRRALQTLWEELGGLIHLILHGPSTCET
eukprot:CAMPEP_0177691012 /NCGR_PEP_ID=MMETSP0484_2-20121128/1075_1 /TAXON_ID=354590 /ORGANISM="Rhodomonas lens, Strain RHODO" /LENGTH=144 /DNA_ID=CAMNT_0019201599 /DNA_START=28 /DNA_END=462 /DNA_ORIENTATION=-